MKQLVLISFILFSNLAQGQSSWQLEKDENQIKVYTREIPGSSFKEYKAVGILSGKIENVISLLQNPDNYINWIPDCKNAHLIQKNENSHIHYIENEAPWPVDNRDLIMKYEYIKKNEHSYYIKVSTLPNFEPRKKDIVRIEQISGFWEIIQISEKKIKIINQIHAEPNGQIPSGIANAFVVNSPYKTLLGMQKQIKE